MCGIVGYIGDKQAAPFLLDGMSKLEYRGYDSAGIAVYEKGKIRVEKCVGRLESLRQKLVGNVPVGTVGIGHTRWATHGRPSDRNAHPHTDSSGDFVVVHNGIIENYMALKEALLEKGHVFLSETDSEVVAHLMEDNFNGNFEETVKKVLGMIEGSYSLVFMCAQEPDKLICTKKDNPLVIGLGNGENFIASDIPAIIAKTRRTYIMNDGEIATVTKDAVWVQDINGMPISKKVFEVNWTSEEFADINKIFIVACGTAYHAGMVGKYYFEQLARIPVEVDIASEFRYRSPIIDSNCLTIIISQSGETSDTLAALKEARRLGSRTLAVTNVVGSSIAREADQVVYTYAGPEIAVASTKAYTTQLLLMLMLSIYVGQIKGTLAADRAKELVTGIKIIPEQIHELLENVEQLKVFATKYGNSEDVFYLGRSLDYAVALEGALKMKEISYIHAEAYAAGELKHGTLALIVEGVPVIVLATQEDVYDKTISNLQEVKARDAVVIAIALEGDDRIPKYADHVIFIPRAEKYLTPLLSVLPLQLLAYYAALTRGCDVDKPRNLAKSVTVE